jgi:hypothetical protein
MTRIKLRGADRLIPKLMYHLEKIGIKLHSKRILMLGVKLTEYIEFKYKLPDNCKWMMWWDGTIQWKKTES